MSSADDRPSGLLSAWARSNRLEPISGPLPEAEPTPPASSTPPIQFPDAVTPSTGQLPPLAPSITRQLPTVTRVLPGVSENTSQRIPVVIKGELKKPLAPSPLPPLIHKKRRQRSSLIGIALLLLISLMALLSATPLGREIGFSFQQGSSLVSDPQNTLNTLVAQATATAIYHQKNDGYDPFYTSGQVISKGLSTLNWPVGECTYWANLRYHQITGNWVAWSGNADQWVDGARKAGWNVSTTPHAPSIIVLMPGTQGASHAYGHVAVVESVSGDVAHTSNMNWYANGGGFDRTSDVDFHSGPGVYFVWHS